MRRRWVLVLTITAATFAGGYLLLAAAFYAFQGAVLFPATHQPPPAGLTVWRIADQVVGLAREAPTPRAIWLILQGNGGQAGPRGYFRRVPPDESLYVLEYPGYGQRPGTPSRASIDRAAADAYRDLRRRFPGRPVGVVGESFGSGPACALAGEATPPDQIVLFVPLARLDLVMQRFIPILPMRLLLRSNWDNPAALRAYHGPVTIIAAEADEVLGREQVRRLGEAVPAAQVIWVPGGHGDASESELARLPAPRS